MKDENDTDKYYGKECCDEAAEGVGVIVITTETAKNKCSNCGLELSRATSFNGSEPQLGDASICVECGNIMIFNEKLELRLPTEQEMEKVRNIPSYQSLLKFIELKKL